jgi:hypothetical protein
MLGRAGMEMLRTRPTNCSRDAFKFLVQYNSVLRRTRSLDVRGALIHASTCHDLQTVPALQRRSVPFQSTDPRNTDIARTADMVNPSSSSNLRLNFDVQLLDAMVDNPTGIEISPRDEIKIRGFTEPRNSSDGLQAQSGKPDVTMVE